MNNIAGFGRPAGDNRGAGGGGGQSEPGCADQIAKMWEGVPLFNRFIFWTSIALYLVSWFIPVHLWLINIPAMVYMKFQLWRVISAPFANLQLLMLLFGLLSYMPRGCQVERMKGTTAFLVYFMGLSIVSQCIMVILDLFVNTLIGLGMQSLSLGLWTMVMVDMTVDSLKDPDMERPLCCFPIMIKSKYYPYIFLIIFGLLFPMGFFALFSGYLAGVMYSYGYLKFVDPSQNCSNKINNSILKPFLNHPAYISPESALDGGSGNPGFSMFPAPGQPSNNRDEEAAPEPSSSNAPVVPFSGAGVRLGSDHPGSSAPPSNNVNTYQQNIREVPSEQPEGPSGPNPLTQKSKLVMEHNARNKGEAPKPQEDEMVEPESTGDNPENTSQNSKNEDEVLLDLS